MMNGFQTVARFPPLEATPWIGIGSAVVIMNAALGSIPAIMSKSTGDFAGGLIVSTRVLSTDFLQLTATLRVHQEGIDPDSLGWTREEAMAARSRLELWAEEWDDPEMDEYNVFL